MRAPLVIFAIITAISTAGLCAGESEISEFHDSLTEALRDMGMTPGDFRIRHDYAEPDQQAAPFL